MATTVTPLTAKEIAAKFDTTPRQIRKFFRAEIGGVDRGNRYAFKPGEVKAMQKKFEQWSAAQSERLIEE